jgi:hypothetical protein
VDEQILNQEQGELRRSRGRGEGAPPGAAAGKESVLVEVTAPKQLEAPPVQDGPFKLDPNQKGWPRGIVRAFSASTGQKLQLDAPAEKAALTLVTKVYASPDFNRTSA